MPGGSRVEVEKLAPIDWLLRFASAPWFPLVEVGNSFECLIFESWLEAMHQNIKLSLRI
jgi:hypothetical protein